MFGLGYLAHVWIGFCARCGSECRMGLCVNCQEQGLLKHTTPGGVSCWGLGRYDDQLAEWIGRLKFHDETILALHLGDALGQLLPDELRACSLLPVPLHPVRLCERGYNQSALLARAIRRKMSPAISFDVLFRTSQTAQQSRLGQSERKGNMNNAFLAIPLPDERNLRQVRDAQILLVDDVITSGSTIDSCALALRSAGWQVKGAICCAIARNDAIFEAAAPAKSQTKIM